MSLIRERRWSGVMVIAVMFVEANAEKKTRMH
jgi:hypothetical protein